MFAILNVSKKQEHRKYHDDSCYQDRCQQQQQQQYSPYAIISVQLLDTTGGPEIFKVVFISLPAISGSAAAGRCPR